MKNENLTNKTECDIIGNTLMKREKKDLNDITDEKISGIYKIINTNNKKYYVGSSEDIKGKRGRWFWHLHFLNKNKHPNRHLQNAWNKYEQSVWKWVIVELVEPGELLSVEQKYLDICELYPNTNYNIAYDAKRPMLGVKHTPETKLKISNRMRGCNNPMYKVIPSPETRLKISISNKGKTKGNKHYNFRKSLTDEHKQKISRGVTGQTRTLETKLNISNALKNRIFTEEHKQKISESNKKYCGINHKNYNHTTYTFINEKTNEYFIGTRYDFMKKYNLSSSRCSKLINGKLKKLKDWIILAFQ